MPWRFAIGAMALPPVLGFGLLSLCPETPVWYMQVGKEEAAKKALLKLRGDGNMDIIEAEFNRIALNVKVQEKESEFKPEQELNLFQRTLSVMSDVTFIKPFGFLMVIFCIGMEWTSLPAIAFYMVPLLM